MSGYLSGPLPCLWALAMAPAAAATAALPYSLHVSVTSVFSDVGAELTVTTNASWFKKAAAAGEALCHFRSVNTPFNSPNLDKYMSLKSINAAVVNATTLTCRTLPTDNAGVALLTVSMDGGNTYSLPSAPISMFPAVEVALSRRPFIFEAKGGLIVRSAPSLIGAALRVSGALASRGGGQQPLLIDGSVSAGATALLEFQFDTLPPTVLRELIVTVSVLRDGKVVIGPLVKRKVFHRAPPPQASYEGSVFQVDHEHRSLLANNQLPFIGVGWFHSAYDSAHSSVGDSTMWGREHTRQRESGASVVSEWGKKGHTLVLLGLPGPAMLDELSDLQRSGIQAMVTLPYLNGVPPNHIDLDDPAWSGPGGYMDQVRGNMSSVMAHPAVHSWYICDDCCKGYDYSKNLSAVYQLLRRHDPYHVTTGAAECNELQAFQEPYLSLDFPLVENYRPDLVFHTGAFAGHLGAAIDGHGGDVSLRLPPLTFEPVANMPGSQRTWSSADQQSLLWTGLVTAGLASQNWFIYGRTVQKRWQMSDAIDQVHAQIQELMPSFYVDVRIPQLRTTVNAAAKHSVIARAWRERFTNIATNSTGARSESGDICMHIIVVNISPHFRHFELSLSGLTDAEVAAANAEGLLPLFDGSCSANPGPGFHPGPDEPGTTRATSEYQCRQVNLTQMPLTEQRWGVSDWLAPSKTNIYRLGCGGRDALTAVGTPTSNLVQNGNMELVQQAGTDGCVMHRMGCLPTWTTLACNDAGRWTDDRAWVSISTAAPHSGRHAARLQLPTAEPVVLSLPLNSYKVTALCKAVGLGPKQPCATILNFTSYHLKFFARAAPMGLFAGGGAGAAYNSTNQTEVAVLLGRFVASGDRRAGWTAQKFMGQTVKTEQLGRDWKEVDVVLPAETRSGSQILYLKFGGAVGAVFLDDVCLLANGTAGTRRLPLKQDDSAGQPANISSISSVRFPMEGVGEIVTLCTSPPLMGLPVSANVYWPGVSLRYPTRHHGMPLAAPVAKKGEPGCFVIEPGVVSNPGPGLLRIVAGNQSTTYVQVTYYESVAVAFGLRPYITESFGSLLLLPDPSVLKTAHASDRVPASVTLHLPFASPPHNVVEWTDSKLLREPEQVLRFSLQALPATVNQDVEITTCLPSGRNITKWRRLMRAPPLPAGSSVLPVQVDHTTKSLLVDGRPHAGVGFYLDGVGHEHGGFHNITDYLVHSSAPNRVNHGMIYRLHTFPAAEQLWVLDQVAAVGFKVMYEVTSQMDDCGDPAHVSKAGVPATCFNESKSADLTALRNAVDLVKGHPAILGFYICDDCCQSDMGAAFQAQAYNFIKAIDSYHAIIGASDCGDTWVFFDSAETCTWRGGRVHPGPAGSCPAPTADTTQPVIGFGFQPRTQLSLDYLMQEDYAGGLASHAAEGRWIEPSEPSSGTHQDGWFRASIPFEPLCNCPETSNNEVALGVNGYSQMWESAVLADMWDQLIFIGGDSEWTSMAAAWARQSAELRPSFRRVFGTMPRPTVTVHVVSGGVGCFAQHDAATASLPGGPLRAAVWTEGMPENSSVCTHLVVINTALTATLVFSAKLSAGTFGVPGTQATRLFMPGPNLNVSHDGQLDYDFIAPGASNVYRIGCDAVLPNPLNLAAPLVTISTPVMAGWESTSGIESYSTTAANVFSHSDYDPRLSASADSSVTVPTARHSLRFNLPTGKAVIIPFQGKALVSKGPWGKIRRWAPGPGQVIAVGDKLPGSSATLPGGRSFRVSLQLQASPCGTTVSLMGGYFEVSRVVLREASEDMQGLYHGNELAPAVTPCGANWTTLETVLKLPPANATVNGTALQLRFKPPPTDRNWGGVVWVGAASITEVNE